MGKALALSKDLAENDLNNKLLANSHGKIGRLVGTEPRIASMKAKRKQMIDKLLNLYMDVRRNNITTEAKLSENLHQSNTFLCKREVPRHQGWDC